METTQITKNSFNKIESRFIELTDEKTFKKEISFATQHISKNAQLQKADPASLLSAVLNVAQFGLTLNPVQKQAYIIPRWDRNTNSIQAYLEPSYQGLITAVCKKGGSIKNMIAAVVYEGDVFEVIQGTQPQIIHKPTKGTKGNITHAYAIAFFKDRSYQFEVMDWKEIEDVRATSQSFKSLGEKSIWGQWLGEMCKKTAIRRLIKYLPQNNDEEVRKLVTLDESDYLPDWNMVHYAEGLLQTSLYDDETKARLEREITSMNKAELDNIITDLQNNQKSIFETGPTMNQTRDANDLSRLS